MPFFIPVAIAVASLFALVAGVADAVRSSRRGGAYPDVSFTYRAYGA